MFIEIALDDLAPTTLMAGRVLVASLVLVGLMAVSGTLGRLRRAGWRAYALGLINSALPFTLIAWGQEHIDSGVAAIANATTPIWVAILAIWLARSERPTGMFLIVEIAPQSGFCLRSNHEEGTWRQPCVPQRAPLGRP